MSVAPRQQRHAVASVLLAALLAHGGPARAQTSYESQETRPCELRLSSISTALDDDARHTRVWYWSWMAAGTALLVSQAVLAGVSNGNLQKDAVVGASASTFIPAFLLIHPPAVLSDAPRLSARLSLTRVDGVVGDPCVALLRARELLARDADDEAFAKAWYAHAFVIGGNLALGLLLGVAFGDWIGFAKQAVGGSLVGEAQIWTLPGGALDARGLGFSF
jgi:hypothetical protein